MLEFVSAAAKLFQDLGLIQILPMLDEETGAEPRAVSASIVDPYLLIIRDDGSVFLAQIDNNNEIEEMEKADSSLSSTKWVAGCLYKDTKGVFHSSPDDPAKKTSEEFIMFLLNSAGALHVSKSCLIKLKCVI
jgi:cleavage and polyadenylation specificity factor subunit 1